MPAGDLQQPARLAVGVLGLAVLLATVVGRVLRWATTHFVLTTERLIFRSGVVAKFGREIPLERINDVTFSQSLFERMIGAGDLLLESAGEHGQSRFSNIRDPEAVQLEIYRQMEANDRRRAGYATTHPHPPANPPRRPGAPGRPPRPRRRHRGGVPAHEARAAGPDLTSSPTWRQEIPRSLHAAAAGAVPASSVAAGVSPGLTPPPQAATESPSARMLRAAFRSRSWVTPQPGQVQMRTFRGFGPSRWPHAEHSCDDGNHRSTFTTVRPYRFAL